MSRKTLLAAFAAMQSVFVGFVATPAANAATQAIPDYFFKEWTVSANCTEQHAGLAARVATGLKFQISKETASEDGTYRLTAVNSGQKKWAGNWNGLKLEYRPGTQMTTVPADFECIPGAESSSPFLAMSGYVQSAEPYYGLEHWYGLAKIHGQLEHVLIFPRNLKGEKSAIIVLQSASSPTDLKLDDDGVIHSNN